MQLRTVLKRKCRHSIRLLKSRPNNFFSYQGAHPHNKSVQIPIQFAQIRQMPGGRHGERLEQQLAECLGSAQGRALTTHSHIADGLGPFTRSRSRIIVEDFVCIHKDFDPGSDQSSVFRFVFSLLIGFASFQFLYMLNAFLVFPCILRVRNYARLLQKIKDKQNTNFLKMFAVACSKSKVVRCIGRSRKA